MALARPHSLSGTCVTKGLQKSLRQKLPNYKIIALKQEDYGGEVETRLSLVSLCKAVTFKCLKIRTES
jgi:hypothetical protein